MKALKLLIRCQMGGTAFGIFVALFLQLWNTLTLRPEFSLFDMLLTICGTQIFTFLAFILTWGELCDN